MPELELWFNPVTCLALHQLYVTHVPAYMNIKCRLNAWMCSDCRIIGWPCTSIKVSISVPVFAQTVARAAAYIRALWHDPSAWSSRRVFPSRAPRWGGFNGKFQWPPWTKHHQNPIYCTEECQGNAWSTHGNIARWHGCNKSHLALLFKCK